MSGLPCRSYNERTAICMCLNIENAALDFSEGVLFSRLRKKSMAALEYASSSSGLSFIWHENVSCILSIRSLSENNDCDMGWCDPISPERMLDVSW